MSDDTANTGQVRALPRGLIHKVLETELGKNWRSIRWWSRQFTPVSTTILCSVLTIAGTWIVNLSHKVDNQGTKITVLETQIVPDLNLANRVGELERDDSNHEGRMQAVERAVGKFDYKTADEEAGKPLTVHGQPLQGGRRKR